MTGEPTYIELGVPDADTAVAFYRSLLGWPDRNETGEISTGSLTIGIHGDDESRHFETFFAVEHLEAALAKVTELGGSLVRDIEEAPGFGRFAECSDDQGVRFGLHQR